MKVSDGQRGLGRRFSTGVKLGLGDVRDLVTFCDLARGLERYLVQLMFWVDRQIPWSAVSDLVHGYRLRARPSAAGAQAVGAEGAF